MKSNLINFYFSQNYKPDSDFFIKMSKQNLFYIQPVTKVKPSKALIHDLTQFYGSTPQRKMGKDDLFWCMRILLRFGRLVGIVPISGIFGGNLSSIYFKRRSFAGITSLIIIIIMVINDLIALLAFFQAPAKDASEIARNAAAFFCYAIGLYVFIFMYRNSSKLITCFHKWRDLKTCFHKEDTRLFRSISLVSGIIYTSAIVENMVSHWKFFKNPFIVVNNATVAIPIWQAYYERSHGQYTRVFSYNIVLAIGIFLCNKWAVYAWNFGDILIAVLARAMYKRFQLHYDDLKERMASNLTLVHDGSVWNKAMKDHENLIDLMEEFGSLLSPLIFACAFINIYFICLQLNLFLVPSDIDIVSEIYGAWSFIHLILRTFTAMICCAKVNDCVHKIETLLGKCPVSVLSKEMERTELKLRTTQIGFGGLNTFVITKPFILSVVNVIFTFEIVLLQGSMTPLPAPVAGTGHVKT